MLVALRVRLYRVYSYAWCLERGVVSRLQNGMRTGLDENPMLVHGRACMGEITF